MVAGISAERGSSLKKRAGGMVNASTPMMRQFNDLKRGLLDCLLFFQAGDFYEMFGEDAELGAEALGIALTSRQNKGDGGRLAMCGVPCNAYEQYVNKLVEQGYKVAVVDQMEPPVSGKLVERKVVRVATPGTLLFGDGEGGRGHYILSLWLDRGGDLGGTLADVTTGRWEFFQWGGATEEIAKRLTELCEVERPREVLLPKVSEDGAVTHAVTHAVIRGVLNKLSAEGMAMRLDERPWEAFDAVWASKRLEELYEVRGLDGFGLSDLKLALRATGGLLDYLEHIKHDLLHLHRPRIRRDSEQMRLDELSLRHLEVFGKDSLFTVLNCCCTPMGSRMLRRWLTYPLLSAVRIEKRLDAVQYLMKNADVRHRLRECFSLVKDLERTIARTGSLQSGVADMVALRDSLDGLTGLGEELECMLEPSVKDTKTSDSKEPSEIMDGEALLVRLAQGFDPLDEVKEHLHKKLHSQPHLKLSEGGYIADGVSKELDERRLLSKNSNEVLLQLESKERERTGIASLKVRYNRVFGYYIELPKARAIHAPSEYRRKQTLANAERFTLDELEQLEIKILTAKQQACQLEQELFEDIRKVIRGYLRRMQKTASQIATLDLFSSLAETAYQNQYCKPQILALNPATIDIKGGRHPVLEMKVPFISNDIYLSKNKQQTMLITGPNMAGKSTVMRQTALIQLMAQSGSFVPAKSASLSVMDRIFTRVGAADNLARGQSTFMMEMLETANILNNASPNSLIILDEIGRGTSTYDGISIAWAIAEYLHQAGPLTMFATHYHELTALSNHLPRLINFSVKVHEQKGKLAFTHKLTPEPSDRSYGIQVAKLAGLPPEIIKRASQVIKELTSLQPIQQPQLFSTSPTDNRTDNHTIPPETPSMPETNAATNSVPQSLKPIVDSIKELNVEEITPVEALNLLHKLREKLP